MSVTKPIVKHIYHNHTLDSIRWDRYAPRASDQPTTDPGQVSQVASRQMAPLL